MFEVCRSKCKKQFICCVYKPPTLCSDLLINKLNQSLGNIPSDSEIIILGDFTINFSAPKKDPVYRQTKATKQLIKSATRVSESSKTTIVVF